MKLLLNKYARSIFKRIIGAYKHSILLLLLIISFFNYWSLFFIIGIIKETITNYVEKHGIGIAFLEGLFYGWIGSFVLLVLHHFVLKYWLIHRKIKSAVFYILIQTCYFILLVLFLVYAFMF
ncbi:hypothetical protein ABID96_002200 [Bacillus sp. OAE603]